MTANLLSLGMIALAILTALLCWHSWTGPTTRRRVAWSLVGLFVPFLYPPHMCLQGNSTMQALLGGSCLAAVIICATRVRTRWYLTIGLGVITIALMVHYDVLVHRDDLIGFAGENRLAARPRESRLAAVKWNLQNLDAKEVDRIPPGWISDQRALLDQMTPELRDSVRQFREVGEPHWHSVFTRLYRVRKIPVELWSPGGDLKAVAEGLEWRER